MTKTAAELDTAAAVLDAVRSERHAADAAEARILALAVDWAAMHSVDSIEDAACDWYGNQPIPVAGEGAPLVAEFSIADFATALRLPTDVGKAYVGEALELRYRLPKTWQQVLDGKLPAWRARRIARATIGLTREAAAYVDSKVWFSAHTINPAALDRLVATAIAQFMPAEAEARQQAAAETRHFDIDTRHHDLNGLSGTATVHGTLDLADALDLETAIADVAGQLKNLGSEDSLDVRRAAAVGEIARRQLSLDLTGDSDGPGSSVEEVAQQPSRNQGRTADRSVVLHLHLSEEAIHGAGGVGRLDNVNLAVLEQQIRTWCGTAGQIVVKPVIDLATCAPVDRHDPPASMTDQVDLRDRHCAFPWCSRPARRCDRDHVVPYRPGDSTCACNLAPLCGRHHRLKTHGHWRYLALVPGTYLWTSPYGYQYLVDDTGTNDVSSERSRHGRCATYSTNEDP